MLCSAALEKVKTKFLTSMHCVNSNVRHVKSMLCSATKTHPLKTCTELQRFSALSPDEVYVCTQISEWEPQQVLQTLSTWLPKYEVCKRSAVVDVRTQQGIPRWIHTLLTRDRRKNKIKTYIACGVKSRGLLRCAADKFPNVYVASCLCLLHHPSPESCRDCGVVETWVKTA